MATSSAEQVMTPEAVAEREKLAREWLANCSDHRGEQILSLAELLAVCANEALEKYKASLDHPELEDFAKGVVIEAQHQRQRWGDDHDTTKEPEEWFWLIGYLAGKGLRSQRDGDMEKFKH